MLLDLPPTRRKPSLAPMIDVVFLLLVFFMLAARFGQDVEIDLPLTAASENPYEGPPRLIEIRPDGLRLNGIDINITDLPTELDTLVLSRSDAIVLRPRGKADLQRVVTVIEALSKAGYQTLVLVE